MKFNVFTLFVLLLSSISVFAESALKKELNDVISRFLPDVKVERIEPSPIPGLYQVVVGAEVFYITMDGSYIVRGEIFDVNERRDLTEVVREQARVKILGTIDEDEYIEFAADNARDAIYVFTDIDCGYCRKLHQDIAELNMKGISVRYLAYPRAGVGSATGKKMKQLWCADDRQAALTAAKNRESFEGKSCDDPVAKQHALGHELGVRGTPAIYFEDGRSVPGYMPPDELQKKLRE